MAVLVIWCRSSIITMLTSSPPLSGLWRFRIGLPRSCDCDGGNVASVGSCRPQLRGPFEPLCQSDGAPWQHEKKEKYMPTVWIIFVVPCIHAPCPSLTYTGSLKVQQPMLSHLSNIIFLAHIRRARGCFSNEWAQCQIWCGVYETEGQERRWALWNTLLKAPFCSSTSSLSQFLTS